METPSEKQVSLFMLTMKGNYKSILAPVDDGEVNRMWLELEEWVNKQSKWDISALITIIKDEGLNETFREKFCALYLKQKGYENVHTKRDQNA
jgi:hypothetical protein